MKPLLPAFCSQDDVVTLMLPEMRLARRGGYLVRATGRDSLVVMKDSRNAPGNETVFQRVNLHTGEKMASATFAPEQFRPATPEFNQLVKLRLEDFELEEDARYEALLNRGEHPASKRNPASPTSLSTSCRPPRSTPS